MVLAAPCPERVRAWSAVRSWQEIRDCCLNSEEMKGLVQLLRPWHSFHVYYPRPHPRRGYIREFSITECVFEFAFRDQTVTVFPYSYTHLISPRNS